MLSNKVIQMFLIMLAGYSIVKLGLIKAENSKYISIIVLYIVNPCLHINSFQISLNEETGKAFAITMVAAVVLFALTFLSGNIFQRIFKLSAVEKAAFLFSNQGNLLVPIVTSVLGSEYLIYMCGFMLVQVPILFSYGRILLGENVKITPKSVFGNIGFIDMMIGLFFFLTKIQLPVIIKETFSSVQVMAGPLCMLIAGITLGGLSLKEVFGNKRTYLTVILRLIISPLITIFIIKLFNLRNLISNVQPILYICMLCAAAPSASLIVSISQIYGGDYKYASRLNVMTTLFCILSIPLMALAYEMIIGTT